MKLLTPEVDVRLMSSAIFRTGTNREAPVLSAEGNKCRLTPQCSEPHTSRRASIAGWSSDPLTVGIVEPQAVMLIVAQAGKRPQRREAGDRPPGLWKPQTGKFTFGAVSPVYRSQAI